jgi:hypothetical protein
MVQIANEIGLQEKKEMSWCSGIGIATGYGLDDEYVRIRVLMAVGIFTSPCYPH